MMINLVNGLKIVDNTIMPTAKHPVGIAKYGQKHKELKSVYEELFGGSRAIKNIRDGNLEDEATFALYEKITSWLEANKWVGANIGKRVGLHKIPRNLYHITTKQNYDSMLKTGALKVSDPGGLGAGVYMLELQNMIDHYGNHKGYRGLERLLNQGQLHGDDELVLLKIPTKKLDASRISIRDNGSPLDIDVSKFNIENIIGDSAINSKLYKQRKVGLEYIYPHDIDINDVSFVGSAKVKNAFEEDSISDKEALAIWKTLTQGQPERKAFDVIG